MLPHSTGDAFPTPEAAILSFGKLGWEEPPNFVYLESVCYTSQNRTVSSAQPKIADRFRAALRLRGYSYRTEQAYLQWYVRYVRFHKLRHPAGMGEPEVEAFLSHLATELKVAASTQNQALAALLYLYSEVLKKPLGNLSALRAKRSHYVQPYVSPGEVGRILANLSGVAYLAACIMYGAGLRLMECLRLPGIAGFQAGDDSIPAAVPFLTEFHPENVGLHRLLPATITVTGPSLTSETRIMAPNRPAPQYNEAPNRARAVGRHGMIVCVSEAISMTPKLRQELMEYLNKVPDEKLAQVLAFVRALGVPGPTGLPGEKLKSAVTVLSPSTLDEMALAIDESCERVDLSEWQLSS